MNRNDIPHEPFEQVHVMARLVGEDAPVLRPGSAPAVLIIIALVASPAHPHRPEHELAEATRIERLARFHHWHIEAVLLDHEQLDARTVARGDHRVGVLEPQRHRLLDDDVLARLGRSDRMSGVHPARRQHRHHLDFRIGQHRV